MARLGLSSDSEFTSAWLVLVSSALLPDSYQVEYLLPANQRPWEHAVVQGQSYSVEETKRYVLLAMRESEGWVGNVEFEAVLAQHGLTGEKPAAEGAQSKKSNNPLANRADRNPSLFPGLSSKLCYVKWLFQEKTAKIADSYNLKILFIHLLATPV